jgi:hypothetical protein
MASSVPLAVLLTVGAGCVHPYHTIRRAVEDRRTVEVVMGRAEVRLQSGASTTRAALPQSYQGLAEVFAEELRRQWGTDRVVAGSRAGQHGAEVTILLDVEGEVHEDTGVMQLSLWARPIRTRDGKRLHVSYGHMLGGRETAAPTREEAFAALEAPMREEARLCAQRFAEAVDQY